MYPPTRHRSATGHSMHNILITALKKTFIIYWQLLLTGFLFEIFPWNLIPMKAALLNEENLQPL